MVKMVDLMSWIFTTIKKKQHNAANQLSLSAQLLQSYPNLCCPMDHCSPGASVHGIPQARILEQVAMLSSRGCSWLRNWTPVSLCLLHWQEGSLPLVPPRKTIQRLYFLKSWKITLVYFPMNLTQIMADTMCFLVLHISTYIDMETHLTLHCTKHTTLYYTYFCI